MSMRYRNPATLTFLLSEVMCAPMDAILDLRTAPEFKSSSACGIHYSAQGRGIAGCGEWCDLQVVEEWPTMHPETIAFNFMARKLRLPMFVSRSERTRQAKKSSALQWWASSRRWSYNRC
ncbi:MAG: hypothetical protein ACR2JB_03390 [Bryobacteraceae bacterium]